jgi:hypothetical protein
MPINLPIPSSLYTTNPVGVFDTESGTFGSNESINTNEAVENNIIFEGIVLDKDAKPIPGVTITFTQTPDPNSPPDKIVKPIVETLTTNAKGEWSIMYPETDINLKFIDVVFFKSEYKTEQIAKPRITKKYPNSDAAVIKVSTSETEPPYEYRVGNEIFKNSDQVKAKSEADEYQSKLTDPKYKGASVVKIRKKLKKSPPIKDALKALIQPILNEISKAETDQTKKANNQKVFALVRLAILIEKGKETAKKQLIPFIIKLLLPFGLPVVQAILSKIPIDKVKGQILCPKKDKLSDLIKKRNQTTKKINSLYKTISTMSKIALGISTAIQAIKIGILAIGIVPLPMPPAVPIGADVLGKILQKLGVFVSVATIALAVFGTILGLILGLLNALDAITQTCLQSQNAAESTGNNTGEASGNNAGQTAIETFEKINDELNLFINESTGVNNQTVINNINNQTYKGFTLELSMDPYNPLQYPKRFAQALTRTGVPVLKTDSSFTSDPQVLIEQLKFLIDSNPDLTAG